MDIDDPYNWENMWVDTSLPETVPWADFLKAAEGFTIMDMVEITCAPYGALTTWMEQDAVPFKAYRAIKEAKR